MIRGSLVLGLLIALLATPLEPASQSAGKVYRIGMLETISASVNAGNLAAFRQALRRRRADALIVTLDTLTQANRDWAPRSASQPAAALAKVLRVNV